MGNYARLYYRRRRFGWCGHPGCLKSLFILGVDFFSHPPKRMALAKAHSSDRCKVNILKKFARYFGKFFKGSRSDLLENFPL